MSINITVNGHNHTLSVDPQTPLIYILRNDLKLKSPQFGCGLEQCGACKVLINGDALPSCKRSLESVQGCNITTLEHLGTPENLHPVQRAFLREQAAQCGYCTAGLIIATKALLDQTPSPTDEEIKNELAIHLCRCGSHARILKAVKRAARELANESTT
jgi:nicotinate dehydrogenase subunit A